MKTLRFFSCSLALLVALVSCNINSPEAIIDDVNKLQENSLNTINVVDQLFQFKDLPTLFNIAMQYQSDPEKFENLHKSRQFIALKDIYDEITAEEAYFHEHVQNITEENKTSLLTKGYMGKKAKSYSDMFTFSSTEGIIMRTPYPVLSIFLSPKGLVKIGDDIYQFKDQTIKVITGGDIKKVAYLDKINSTDNSIGIQVRPIQYLPIKSVKQGEVTVQSTQGATPQYVQSGNTFARSADNCIGNPCEYRVIGYENFTAPSGGSGQYIHTTCVIPYQVIRFWVESILPV